MAQAQVMKDYCNLVGYFNSDGYSRYGFRGDADNLSPIGTAIRAMQEFDEFLRSPEGSAAYVAMQYHGLQEKGLVPT